MNIKPLKKYTPPKYPTYTEAKLEPSLLRKLPTRWQKNAAVVAAAGLFGTMTLASCGIFEQNYDVQTAGVPMHNIISENDFTELEKTEDLTELETAAETEELNTSEHIEQNYAVATAGVPMHNIISENDYIDSEFLNYLNVAPVFIHGEGTGAMGCVMVTPSVFLSEQEAFAIIINIAENEGLIFNAEPPAYIAVQNRSSREASSWEDGYYVIGDGKIGLDLYDAENQVAVAFISMPEALAQLLSNQHGVSVPTVSMSAFFPRELAELSAEDFARQKGDISIGVFYEPGYDRENEEVKSLTERFHEKSNALWEIYRDTLNELMEENYDEYLEKHREYWDEFQVIRDEYDEQIKAIIAEDLRSQVRDFIEWLQAQGII